MASSLDIKARKRVFMSSLGKHVKQEGKIVSNGDFLAKNPSDVTEACARHITTNITAVESITEFSDRSDVDMGINICQDELMIIVLYDVRPCIMDEVLKKIRLPTKSSYYLEQYNYSERTPTVARPQQRSSYHCNEA
ncbi:hypothetical protein HAX54_043071 [Datura stramonium]|uniref:Uncharacterized protein n=1 Tax=Datura stramonium TaxID=4076 RepID=A0ABS8SMN2_DATST|nr:hypothetical protein [Datura stramonium]